VDAFLGEVADAVVLGLVDFAAVREEDAPDTFHEGGLAGAVMAGEGNAFLIPDGKGEIFKNNAGSEFHAEVFDGKHAGGLVEESGI